MSQLSPDDVVRMGQVENAVRTGSRPSDLKITDMRIAVVCSNYDYPILRIDTNQGVYGIGEVRDAPGLGVDLNLEGIAANLRFPGLFEPTEEWNTPKLGFWQPDRRWDK